MYKILIAENQEGINTVKKILECVKKRIEIIGAVSSGADLIELTKEHKPDILVINVDLLGINGLEAAKRIRNFNRSIHIVMFSDYDYFDFAIEAINIRVDDYILKPLYYDTIGKSIEKIIDTIDLEKDKNDREKDCNSLKKTYNEYIDYSFIYTLLFNGQYNIELERYRKLLDLTDYGYVMNIEIEMEEENNSIDRSLLYDCIKTTISKECRCVVGPVTVNKIAVIIQLDTDTDEIEINALTRQMADNVIAIINKVLNIKVSIGIGSVRKIEDIHVSYEEAVLSLRYIRRSNVVAFREIRKMDFKLQDYLEIESKLIESMKFGREDSLNLFLDLLEVVKPISNEAKKNKIIELLILLTHEARLEPQSVYEYVDYVNYFEEIKNLTWEQVESWAYQKIEYAIKAIKMNRKTKRSHFIDDAIYYMERHYHEEISLDDLSQYIGLSPQHLSKLFKDETGINYVEWLTNLRIDMAKNLLSEGTQTVKEICYSVGYNDPNYFSRIFKRIVGISPTDYANGGQMANNNN